MTVTATTPTIEAWLDSRDYAPSNRACMRSRVKAFVLALVDDSGSLDNLEVGNDVGPECLCTADRLARVSLSLGYRRVPVWALDFLDYCQGRMATA